MKKNLRFNLFFSSLAIVTMLAAFTPSVFSQSNNTNQEDPNLQVFIQHLHDNWDDIHDVVMRYHYTDPELKGTVFIQMDWQNGLLNAASVDSNNTGNASFGLAIIEAMKKWTIPELEEHWAITIPIRTEIVGSNQPEFHESGILTGIITDQNGKPVHGVELNLLSKDNLDKTPNKFYTNREGIFIKTLIPAGNWRLQCSKDGYETLVIDSLSFEKGEHVKLEEEMKE